MPPESADEIIPDLAVPPITLVLPESPDAAPVTGDVATGALEVVVSVPAVSLVKNSARQPPLVVDAFCESSTRVTLMLAPADPAAAV